MMMKMVHVVVVVVVVAGEEMMTCVCVRISFSLFSWGWGDTQGQRLLSKNTYTSSTNWPCKLFSPFKPLLTAKAVPNRLKDQRT